VFPSLLVRMGLEIWRAGIEPPLLAASRRQPGRRRMFQAGQSSWSRQTREAPRIAGAAVPELRAPTEPWLGLEIWRRVDARNLRERLLACSTVADMIVHSAVSSAFHLGVEEAVDEGWHRRHGAPS
jgi:hypothetical protein